MKLDGDEVTTFVARHIKPGKEKAFENWMHRISSAVAQQPGFRGITIIAPEENNAVRYILYKFSDSEHLQRWEKSATKKQFIKELRQYATQHYARASGMETWFTLHKHHLNAPPRWKMFLTALSGVYITSIIARILFTPYIGTWHLLLTTAIYSTITVGILTWFYMPTITKLLRRWLYPEQ
jgi:uncharacterized protein